jgi:transcriptional regulator with XRE-family HTH domain
MGRDARDAVTVAFGQTLREHRTAKGVSQEDLALIADVDRTFVSQIERGIRQPTITVLVKLSGALGIPASKLIVQTEKLLRINNVK